MAYKKFESACYALNAYMRTHKGCRISAKELYAQFRAVGIMTSNVITGSLIRQGILKMPTRGRFTTYEFTGKKIEPYHFRRAYNVLNEKKSSYGKKEMTVESAINFLKNRGYRVLQQTWEEI